MSQQKTCGPLRPPNDPPVTSEEDAKPSEDDVTTLEELLQLAEEVDGGEPSNGNNAEEAVGAEDQEDDGGASGFTGEEVELLSVIGHALSDAMSNELCECDPFDEISDDDRQEIMFVVFDRVLKAMKKKGTKELDEEDHAFVQTRVREMAIALLPGQPPAEKPKRRFAQLDRVVCRVGGEREWAAGAVQALDQEDEEKDPYKTFPYVVRIDPPNSFLFSVPDDTNDCVRAEVCFGSRANEPTAWTLYCVPRAIRRGGARHARRFQVGERAACAVEASDDNYTDWVAGTVSAVDHPVASSAGQEAAVVPYQVRLDGGATVLVHQDEHWLIRDLELQPVGPRVAADGTRVVARMGKRKLSEDEWQTVDHVTRRCRKMAREECEECA
jgi:hypothetical protein